MTADTASAMASRSFDRILLVKPSSLGDIVHALPVLHGLRVRYPQAQIDWLIGAAFAPLLKGHPDLDELVPFDRRRYSRIGRSPRAIRAFYDFVRHLRGRRYQLVIDLQGLFRTGFLSWASAAPTRIGFRHAREGATFFYNHFIEIDNPDTHAVDRNYAVADMLGFHDVPIEFNLPIADDARNQADVLLCDAGIHNPTGLVLIAPGARWETKRWPAERFVRVIDELQGGSGGVQCVLVGANDESVLCDRIADACRRRPGQLAGRTSLQQLSAMLRRADAVLCHDSAVSHLAGAHRALVCLMGPTNPSRTGPYRRGDAVLQVALECSPCYLRKLSQCRHDHRCMRELQPHTVVAAVRQALHLAAAAPA